jgi:hypothetical protein
MGKMDIVEWRLLGLAAYTSLADLSDAMKPHSFDGLISKYDPPDTLLNLNLALKAGTPVSLTARHLIVTQVVDGTLIRPPVFEALITGGAHVGRKVYVLADQIHRIIKISDSDLKPGLQGPNQRDIASAASRAANRLRCAMILEEDNKQYVIKEYQEISFIDMLAPRESKLAKAKLAALGITLPKLEVPPALAEFEPTINVARSDGRTEITHDTEKSIRPVTDEPKVADLGGAAPTRPRVGDGAPAHQRDKPTIRILDSNWDLTPSGNFINVSCMIRNMSQDNLKNLIATVIYKDQDGKLVRSDDETVGNLGPGETTTFKTMDAADNRIQFYSIQFAAYVNGELMQLRTLKPND